MFLIGDSLSAIKDCEIDLIRVLPKTFQTFHMRGQLNEWHYVQAGVISNLLKLTQNTSVGIVILV